MITADTTYLVYGDGRATPEMKREHDAASQWAAHLQSTAVAHHMLTLLQIMRTALF